MTTVQLTRDEARLLGAIQADTLSEHELKNLGATLHALVAARLVQVIERPNGTLLGACLTAGGRRYLAAYLGPDR